MKMTSLNSIGAFAILLFLAMIVTITSGLSCSGNAAAQHATIESLQAQLKQFTDEQSMVEEHLTKFDELDFDVYTNQKWDRLLESHAKDISVYWPDGHLAEGNDVHIEDLKKMFVFAPDTRIEVHPIRIGSGKYTAVTGVLEGTFTQPMPIGNGEFIQPTGRAFKLPMCTFGIWENGVMVREHLFWDNQAFMKQIGLSN